MKKILLTGGAGYLGSVLTPLLLEEGYHVTILDRMYFGENSLKNVGSHPKLKIIKEDIMFHENIPSLFDGIDTVVHLASISNDPSCDLDPNLAIQTNYLATISLARRAKSEGVERFIFMSSCSVYGACADETLDISSPVHPVTLYALTKVQAEKTLQVLSDKKFIPLIFRLGTLFGVSSRMRFDLAVNAMTRSALLGKNISINGEGKQFRPFLHVADAAGAILSSIKKSSFANDNHVFNVASEKNNLTIAALGQVIQSEFPELKIERIPFNNDRRSYQVQANKYHKEIGFSPSHSVVDGVIEIRKAFKDGVWPNLNDERFYNIEVVKKEHQGPLMAPSLSSSPLWASDELLDKG